RPSFALLALVLGPQDRDDLRNFFLDRNDALRLGEALLELLVLPREALDLLRHRVVLPRLPPPPPALHGPQGAAVPLTTPHHQVRRVETLSPQQRPDVARLPASVRRRNDSQLVLRRERAAHRLRRDLRVRRRRSRNGVSATGRRATLAAPPLRHRFCNVGGGRRLIGDGLLPHGLGTYFHRVTSSSSPTLIPEGPASHPRWHGGYRKQLYEILAEQERLLRESVLTKKLAQEATSPKTAIMRKLSATEE